MDQQESRIHAMNNRKQGGSPSNLAAKIKSIRYVFTLNMRKMARQQFIISLKFKNSIKVPVVYMARDV